MTGAAPLSARDRLLGLVNASWTTQALATAARLRLPELLGDEPASAHELASRCGCHPAALHRLLRALATLEVVIEAPDGRYGLGPLGSQLRSDQAGGLGPWAEYCGTFSWQSWQRLHDCVRSGQSVRQLDGGAAGLQHLDVDPEAASLFNRAMASLSRHVADSVAEALPLEGARCIVDVGGGTGELALVLLSRHPRLRAVLYDRPHAAHAARERIERAGLGARCGFVPGDFFQGVPPDGDRYLLKSVLHDWDDERACAILRRCRESMPHGARLGVIERLRDRGTPTSFEARMVARSDLNMLVGPGGRERTLAEYRQLLEAAGFRVLSTMSLVDGYALVDAQSVVPAIPPQIVADAAGRR
jgi:orsellinic acid C2-O-methyltransferase